MCVFFLFVANLRKKKTKKWRHHSSLDKKYSLIHNIKITFIREEWIIHVSVTHVLLYIVCNIDSVWKLLFCTPKMNWNDRNINVCYKGYFYYHIYIYIGLNNEITQTTHEVTWIEHYSQCIHMIFFW